MRTLGETRKAAWTATLDRAIRWIEQPDSEF